MLTKFEPPPRSLPFRFGSSEQFAALRALLQRHGYVEAAVYARLAEMEAAEAAQREEREKRPALAAGQSEPARSRDRLGLLLDLFRGAAVPLRSLRREIGAEGVALLETFSLIEPDPADAAAVRATVLLYPTESLYVVSDVHHMPEGNVTPPPDTVYPAVTRNTQQFLRLLPRIPCERFLELCAGTGIAAMVASRFAQHAWAVDITERATRFAQFNVLLNGIQNVTALQGDLYDAVSERTFDRIVAHPPYVPASRQEFIFRDGGIDGEAVTRRTIAGLAEHLEPGGRFYCTCMATDRREAPLEQRVREMLGEHEDDFDVIVAQRWSLPPGEYYSRVALEGQDAFEEAVARRRELESAGVERLVYGAIVVQRLAEPREAFTVRHQVSERTDASALSWLLDWHSMVASPAAAARLLEERPFAAPGVELRVVHREQAGSWPATECSVAARYPFDSEAECSVWVPQFMAHCDGTVSVREHLRRLKERGVVGSQATEEEFASFVRNFLDHGFLQLERCRIPATSGPE
ncbi:MAG TPA: methyltransferase [Gemmatimonadaceae bacterium]|nr:methyltransferase [Gemmatimonadaceae bacterium]